MGIGPLRSLVVHDPNKMGQARETVQACSSFGLICRLAVNGFWMATLRVAPPTDPEIDASEYGDIESGSTIIREELARRKAARSAR
jgi:hypothetical protein